jgi:ABC-2 type transport system ATP-binding protein
MPEAAPLYPEMRVREYLSFRAELKGIARGKRKQAVGDAMAAARVSDMEGTLIGHLSKGYRQRVGLADALVAKPPLLILDEPTAGLDPNQIREVRDLLKDLGRDHTILLSTHILSEVESTCDRAIVIHRGALVAEGSVKELRERRAPEGATVVVSGSAETARGNVLGLPFVERVEVASLSDGAQRIAVTFRSGESEGALERVVTALVTAGLGVREAMPTRATLEDVFAELTALETQSGGGPE